MKLRKDLAAKIKEYLKDIADCEDVLQLVRDVNVYNGSLQGYEMYFMDEIDDIFGSLPHTKLFKLLADDFDFNADGYKDKEDGLHSCSIQDAADEIRDNAEEIAETIMETMQEAENNGYEIGMPSSLEKYLEFC